jgi:hypothetical protein
MEYEKLNVIVGERNKREEMIEMMTSIIQNFSGEGIVKLFYAVCWHPLPA